ncbi:pentapeptide repeat-containing protein [Blastococcus sp. KM273129]|uniref:pentapeptide repeat-containing protein n=1 Tax=Blastococcus sp. KM273129 TaxID=2570315 RepID=UPI001F452C9C|nr:pentapeptide repeat-containing protein [Blastococcus sp. KM273129]MCF6734216.1 pentapeptide repeat-containing protein [Blastococcus sp. KM273129]
MPRRSLPLADVRARLRADCSRCAGLCCVAPAFAASADFAVDKPAGTPCVHLADDFRCGIHDRLRERGFPGCTVFDCFGAGQRITRETFGGRSWREDPGLARAQFAVLPVVRQLHEMLWHLTEAAELPAAAALAGAAGQLRAEVERAASGDADELAALDLVALRGRVGELLGRVSTLARGGSRARDRRGADLVGRDLRRTDLRGAGLRGAYLIGADLRGVDLGTADLLGADLRGADLRGADLGRCLFLTQPQVSAARGDGGTRLPAAVRRPAHWAARVPPR